MGRKVSLRIAGRPYEIKDIQEPFVSFLEQQLKKDFSLDGNNDVLSLLQAYIRKNHELFLQEQNAKALIQKIEEKNIQ